MAAPGEQLIAGWGTSRGDRVEVYQGTRLRVPGLRPRRYHWRRVSANGEVLAVNDAPYTNYEDCRRIALRVNPPVDPRSWTGRR